VNDATWIADLLAHGLIRGSFVPPARIQELRDLTRTRKQLVREISQHSLRIQKTLEDANIKLASVLSNVLGKSGRAMLKAIIGGEDDPEHWADLARDRPRSATVSSTTTWVPATSTTGTKPKPSSVFSGASPISAATWR
jgi:transposase